MWQAAPKSWLESKTCNWRAAHNSWLEYTTFNKVEEVNWVKYSDLTYLKPERGKIKRKKSCWALAVGLGACRGCIPKPKANMKWAFN